MEVRTRTRVKLCGLRRIQDIEAANRLPPDYIGFVFVPKSRRYVTPYEAARFRQLLNPAIKAVGVFAGGDPKQEAGLAREGVIDLIQLHGQESGDHIRQLQNLTDCPVIQALSMDDPTEKLLEAVGESRADYLLLDSGTGGTGRKFDWYQMEQLKKSFLEKPYFLAGGLNFENVGEAVRRFRPYGVDVSSGIETEGKKDEKKMAAFVKAVRKEG